MCLRSGGKVELMYKLGHYHYAMVIKALALEETAKGINADREEV